MVYEEIDKNKSNTFILMTVFTLVIVGLGYVLGEVYGNAYAGLFISFIIAFFSTIGSYYYSDKIVLAMTGAKPADPGLNIGLYNSVAGLALAAGFAKPPAIYILPDQSINAFATGRNPEHSVIAVTEGALKKFDKYELEGVIAHEMSHIKNYDILISTIAVVLTGTIVLMSDWIKKGIFRRFSSTNRQAGGIFILVAIVAAIMAPLAASVIHFAVSRQREYMADAQAVLLTRYPAGLVSALEKIKKEYFAPAEQSEAMESMYFASRASFSQADSMFSTHPPIEKRIARLKGM